MSKKKAKEAKATVEPAITEDDTATTSWVSQEAIPEIDKKYGAELANAFSHISKRALFISIGADNTGFPDPGPHLDSLADKAEEKLVISWPTQSSAWVIQEMAKRNLVLNQNDTKYLRIAVKFAKDRTLKDTLLVFNRRK